MKSNFCSCFSVAKNGRGWATFWDIYNFGNFQGYSVVCRVLWIICHKNIGFQNLNIVTPEGIRKTEFNKNENIYFNTILHIFFVSQKHSTLIWLMCRVVWKQVCSTADFHFRLKAGWYSTTTDQREQSGAAIGWKSKDLHQ